MTPPSPAESVLVLDDEPQLLQLMAKILERAGFDVETADRADQALGLLEDRRAPRDAVVLDMAIPPNGAEEVMRAARSHGDRVGIVLISGDLLDPRLREPLRDCDGIFLRKPFVPRELVRAIAEARESARAGEAR